ncbi:hypothetical protein KKF91_22285 [Myxococcota bacterium]|nr:hypothetical protein [Myxococcota bacterium]MBU1433270.1 hypothetical protein [Myxococcota bacterium]MBU1897843.1 hypothetical protein [Myxococcota bacterium]
MTEKKPGHDRPKTDTRITLGPARIAEIGQAVERLSPWLVGGRLQVNSKGEIHCIEPEPAEALDALRAHVKAALPDDTCDLIGERSGLGWDGFMGHVIAWWMPQRHRVGLLRALTDRAALHDVDLRLHWNQGRQIPTRAAAPGAEALIWGGVFGLIGAFASTRVWPREGLLAMMILAAGVVLGRVYQRVVTVHRCGDPLCQAPLRGEDACPSCGATLLR